MIQNAEKFRSPIDEELRKMQENAQKLNEKMEEIPELVEEETKKIENNKTNDNINDKFEFFKELLALKDCKIKIIPTFEDIEKIFEKKKYQGIFDVIVLGFIHSGYLKKPELAKISKKNVEIWMESTKFLVPIKQKEREELNLKLSELAKSMNLKERVMEKDYHKRFNFE